MRLPCHTRRLYIQPRLFTSVGPFPTLSQLTVACTDDTWSVGAQVIDLSSLEPLAITALPGQQALEARDEALDFLRELLDVQAELSGFGPFQ